MVTKPSLVSVLYLSMRYTVLFIRAPLYVLLVFIAMCSCLLVVLVKYMIQLCPVFYIATLIAPPGAIHSNCAHIVPSTIYANTTLRLGSLVSGTAFQHM